jgi:hypothetical protein
MEFIRMDQLDEKLFDLKNRLHRLRGFQRSDKGYRARLFELEDDLNRQIEEVLQTIAGRSAARVQVPEDHASPAPRG